jgi:hypothetical protein
MGHIIAQHSVEITKSMVGKIVQVQSHNLRIHAGNNNKKSRAEARDVLLTRGGIIS